MNIAIVGAGVIGCAVAYELASRGARVRLLDPRDAGQGATRASAGVLAPHIEGHAAPLLALALGSLDRYDDFVARAAADGGLPIEYERGGTLQVACDDGEAAGLEEAARRLASTGVAHTLLGGGDARALEPALAGAVRAGLLVPQHGYVGVRTLMAALVSAASRLGATFSRAAVRKVESRDGRVAVETEEGTMAADAVVLAAGSWSGGLPISDASVPVRPVRGQLLHLRLPGRILSRVVWGTRSYLVPWQDGSVLAGATVEEADFDESATVAGVLQLLTGATELVPAIGAAVFDEVRVGLRPATADELPVVGRSSRMRGVYYATGHYRNGVLLAPLTAALVADLIVDGREGDELALVRPDRFGL